MNRHAGNTVETHDFDAGDLVEPPAGRERRIDDRKVIGIRSTVTLPEETVLQGHTVDISSGGAAVTVPIELAPGQDCVISLELEACGTMTAFRIPAEVRYCVPLGGNRFRTGVRFGQTDGTTSAFIAAVLRLPI
ncbi:MAG TPA: PilZ domain-containing protein [Steroidobacteraceae bacterium]|jgi:c-di-GMP-binding flagellar brake protein YcgR|nr:PilZ domain-containing protein [Steroidobacteraceae bacterium]